MRLRSKLNFSVLSFLIIPIMIFWNPQFLSLMGVQPYWPLFWLLPWAIIYGPMNGFFSGIFLGLVLDALNNDYHSQIPGLVICGIWFGRLSVSRDSINKFKFGLLTSMGTLICGLVYFSQIILFSSNLKSFYLFSFAIKNIFSQVFLTGILAPIFCSWLFLLFDKRKLGVNKFGNRTQM